MAVYIIHFERPFKHARHYVGFAKHVQARIDHHRNGTGARLMSVIREAGISWIVSRIWKRGDRTFERRIKNRKSTPRLCPVCLQKPPKNVGP